MKFDDYDLDPEIKRNLKQLGFKRPTDIQFKAIRHILQREDVLAIAQTGTGKTAAFAIPIIQLLHAQKSSKRIEGIRCLVMVPTRELAIQLTEVFEQIEQHTRVKTFSTFGGVEQGPQIAQLAKGVDILVTTPGRMFDLVSQGHIKLDKVEILVLDEADHMLDLGFIKDIQDLTRHLPTNRQTLFFSATITKKIKRLAYSLIDQTKAIRIQISPKNPVAKNVNHSVAFIEMDDKRFFLERIIRENPESKILVFVRTKVRAERVVKAMARVDIQSQNIHGGKEQKDRISVLGDFKSGKNKVLIATDVSARGIDIPNVDYVVNYDLPEQADNYVHRCGRTGRGRLKGQAISFCSEQEKPLLAEIEKYTGDKIEVTEIESDTYKETLVFTEDHDNDWKALMKQAAKEDAESLGKRRKKKRK